jgi:hypothetical protein
VIQHRNGKEAFLHTARTLPPEARIMGVYLLGASRAGKSRMLGRHLAWQDYIATPAIGQVLFDGLGVSISNFLDKLIRFLQYVPSDQHERYWRRIRYVDVSGITGFVPGLPLYYRLHPEETLAAISDRFLQVTLRSSPHLANAQYFGWPPFNRFGQNVGILCASLGLQITDIESLISHPEQWLSRFQEAEARFPEAKPACDFFRTEYLPMRLADRARLTNVFRDKVFQFSLNPVLARQFGAKKPSIDWEEVEAEGLIVLLDCKGETNPELRRFKMLWFFDYLFNWIKFRGRRSQPLGLLFDEFSSMTQKVFSGENPFATELDSFLMEYLRNSNILLTIAHQSIQQLDEKLRNTLLSLGTYIFGRATMPDARILADALFKRDPYLVKHWRKVWAHDPILNSYSGRIISTNHFVIDHEPEFMPLDQQQELFAAHLANLGLFQFLCRPALGEGDVSPRVFGLSLQHDDVDPVTGTYVFPDENILSQVRPILAAKDGIPTAAIRKELDAALPTNRAARDGNAPRQREQPPAHPPGKSDMAPTIPHQPPQRRHQRRQRIT